MVKCNTRLWKQHPSKPADKNWAQWLKTSDYTKYIARVAATCRRRVPEWPSELQKTLVTNHQNKLYSQEQSSTNWHKNKYVEVPWAASPAVHWEGWLPSPLSGTGLQDQKGSLRRWLLTQPAVSHILWNRNLCAYLVCCQEPACSTWLAQMLQKHCGI